MVDIDFIPYGDYVYLCDQLRVEERYMITCDEWVGLTAAEQGEAVDVLRERITALQDKLRITLRERRLRNLSWGTW
ncbi:hypothetical protein LP414_27645 [Polaromonas sp. P1(28)-13]|nr:hypothetical protein LP414_27645 [Polaromonas sp. P1(28)-13]